MKSENNTPSFLLPSCLAGDMHAVLWGLIYVVVYISMIVTVPVLIIYAAILWLLHQLTTRSAR